MSPYVQAVIFCDMLTEDKTGKKTLIGVFDAINLETIPGSVPRFFIYVKIGGLANSTVTPEVRLKSPSGTLFQFKGDPISLGPGGASDIVVEATNPPFAVQGDHELEVLLDGQRRSVARLIVRTIAQPETAVH